MFSYCFNRRVCNQARTAVSRVYSVLGVLGIWNTESKSVEHFVVGDEFVGERGCGFIYDFQLVVEKAEETVLKILR